MARLVEDYERANLTEPAPVSGLATLQFLLEQNGLTGDHLGRIIGLDRSSAYRILKGTRNLTAEHIKKLWPVSLFSADLLSMDETLTRSATPQTQHRRDPGPARSLLARDFGSHVVRGEPRKQRGPG